MGERVGRVIVCVISNGGHLLPHFQTMEQLTEPMTNGTIQKTAPPKPEDGVFRVPQVRWGTIQDGVQYQMGYNTRWVTIPEGVQYKMWYNTRWGAIQDRVQYKMGYNTRWGAIQDGMQYKMGYNTR